MIRTPHAQRRRAPQPNQLKAMRHGLIILTQRERSDKRYWALIKHITSNVLNAKRSTNGPEQKEEK